MNNGITIKRDASMQKEEVQLHRWLTGYWSRSKATLPAKLELRQVSQHGEGQKVTEWSQEDFKGKSPHEIADMIIETANDDALNASESGMVKYAILGFRDDKKDYDGRCYLRVKVRNEDFNSDNDSDVTPDWKGQYGQILNHNGQLFRSAIGAFGQVLGSMERRLNRSDEMQEKLLDKHVEILALINTLQDRSEEKSIRLKKEEHDIKMQEELIKSLPKYLSVIANKMIGNGDGNPKHVTATQPLKDDIVRKLMRSIYDSPDTDKQAKIGSVFQSFSKEEIAMFVELWETYEAEFKKEDESKEKSNVAG